MFPLSVGLVAFASCFGLVASQGNPNSTAPYPYSISPNDPNATPDKKNLWCRIQMESCPQLCPDQNFLSNDCNPTNLTYTCQCGDMSYPDVTAYQQTLPFFECLIFVDECVARSPLNRTAQLECRAIKCGPMGDPAQRQKQLNASASSTMPSPTSMPTGMSTAPSTTTPANAPANTSQRGAAAHGKNIGMGALLVGGLTLFGFML